ncbi:tRNA 2-selenouridine(34) synthase MnmH [Frigoriglobus tundricola]|uniref:Selenophosphate-dependent tRNA 2-selenouridine synthase n=1 Tax=Frigoriglobus tundricola TaxID=2774151 RepID=A0A6M5Z0T1_9BACT|nr:tRNA 2-selenouridine(34) synthase MnmH [Frigoriglobus tundricola]QJW99775.1 Selenophosphate-dependent tRNA 2-selenouridine synthase [Frigoriglobus tundricola]
MPPPSPPTVNTPQYTDALWGRGRPCPYDEVIDVRSPSEFAEDHIPGAVNLPVLSDAQRATVGTVFCQQGGFPARKLGAADVSVNIARHLREHFATKNKEYRPLVYCWRGGQRSASLATVLAHVGWRVTVLRGGYKTYRAHVRRELDVRPGTLTFRVLAGPTGSGKTRLLHALASRGAQVLDLEALAVHRGSVLGAVGRQPTQKLFDSRLLAALDTLSPAEPVWVEAESHKVGAVLLPAALWRQMRASHGVEVRVPTSERVRYLLGEYAALLTEPEALKSKLRQFVSRHGARQIESWCLLADAGAWSDLAGSLLAVHYDPAYTSSARRSYPHVSRSVDLPDASPEARAELARLLCAVPTGHAPSLAPA